MLFIFSIANVAIGLFFHKIIILYGNILISTAKNPATAARD